MPYSRKNSNKNHRIQNSPSALGSQSNIETLKHWKKEIELHNTNRYRKSLTEALRFEKFSIQIAKIEGNRSTKQENGIRFFSEREKERGER